MKVIFVLLFTVLAAILLPILLLWCVETIWKIPMTYSVWEWLAAVVFICFCGFSINRKSNGNTVATVRRNIDNGFH